MDDLLYFFHILFILAGFYLIYDGFYYSKYKSMFIGFLITLFGCVILLNTDTNYKEIRDIESIIEQDKIMLDKYPVYTHNKNK